jgi:ATP-binding cassette subfamily F protein 3
MQVILDRIRTTLPAVNDDILQYITDILETNRIDYLDFQEVEDALRPILEEVAHNKIEQDAITELCQFVCDQLRLETISNGNGSTTEPKKLLTPVSIGHYSGATYDEVSSALFNLNDRTFIKPNNDTTTVSQKKLEKAEAKLREKQEKRARDGATNGENKAPVQLDDAVVSQAMNKRLLADNENSDGSNKSYDIHIDNFDVSYGNKMLILGGTLDLIYGRRYGFVGRNGLGKSTLLRVMANRSLVLPSHLRILHVEQEIEGTETIALQSVLECDERRNALLNEEKELNKRVQISNGVSAAQDSFISKRLTAIYTELESIEAHKAESRAAVILSGLGFTSQMQSMATKQFSGGWRMRLALARALFSKPDLLLLDEPTNMLDLKAIIWLENYLQTWKSTLLVVSHDRTFLNIVATDILYLHAQKLESYRGNYDTFVSARTERLKNQQREYEAQKEYRDHIQVFIDRFRYNANRAAQVQSKLKLLDKLPVLQPVEKEHEVHFRFPDPEPLNGTILQLDDVVFAYSKNSPIILNNVNLSVNLSSRISIMGENGSGKTTLLKLLVEELEPTKGQRHGHRNLALGYFTQHFVDQLPMNVNCVELLQSKFPGKTTEQYRAELGRFGITGDTALQTILSLSGGQKCRVAFSLMCMKNPHILVLDEPTNHLDMETIEALSEAIKKFQGGVVLVSHDELLIKRICTDAWLCRNGSVISLEYGFDQYKKLIESELQY